MLTVGINDSALIIRGNGTIETHLPSNVKSKDDPRLQGSFVIATLSRLLSSQDKELGEILKREIENFVKQDQNKNTTEEVEETKE